MQIRKLENQIAAEEAERAAPGKSRAEEEYFLATLVASAERKEISRLQREVGLKHRLMQAASAELDLLPYWGVRSHTMDEVNASWSSLQALDLLLAVHMLDTSLTGRLMLAGARGSQEAAGGPHEPRDGNTESPCPAVSFPS